MDDSVELFGGTHVMHGRSRMTIDPLIPRLNNLPLFLWQVYCKYYTFVPSSVCPNGVMQFFRKSILYGVNARNKKKRDPSQKNGATRILARVVSYHTLRVPAAVLQCEELFV